MQACIITFQSAYNYGAVLQALLLILQKVVIMQPESRFIVILRLVVCCGVTGVNISVILVWSLVNIRFASIAMQRIIIGLFKMS